MKILGLTIVKEIYLPILIIIIEVILERLLKFTLKKTFNPKKHKRLDTRKSKTMSSLIFNIVKYILRILAILMILDVFGINTNAILTGLGVASLVVGLAFQDILKDVLVGISIMLENQFVVGDLVKIEDFEGTVTHLTLKTTRIKSNSTGEIKIIANRNISEVINYSMDKTVAIVDVPVSYECNIDEVVSVLSITIENIKEDIKELSGDINVLGVQELADSSVVIRVVATCKPGKHYEVKRILKKEFKNALDRNGISIPYNQIVVHNEK